MYTIYKYALTDIDNTIELPDGANVLSAGVQGRDVYIWVNVDTQNYITNNRFLVIGTGWDMSEYSELNLNFINAVFLGSMVFHVFEVIS